MTLDVSGVEPGAKRARAAIDGVSASAEKAGEASERSFDALLAPLEQISKKLSQMGASLSELTGLSRQNGAALADLGNKLSSTGTAAGKAEQSSSKAGKALKDTEGDVLDFAAAAVRSNQRMAELSQELQNLTDHKKALEQNGLGLGFQDYDQTVARIRQIKAAQKEYQAALSKPATVQVNSSQVDSLTAKLRRAKADLASLEGAGFGLGDANYDAQYQEVVRLTQAAKEYKAALAKTTNAEMQSPALGNYLRGLTQGFAEAGKAALSAAGNVARFTGGAIVSGVKGLWSGLKKAAAHLSNIGGHAKSSAGGLNGMVKSIRNLGVAALGLKAVTAIFGELRSVVTQYLSENQAAQNAVNSLKSAFANALAPAINIAINALNAILPYI